MSGLMFAFRFCLGVALLAASPAMAADKNTPKFKFDIAGTAIPVGTLESEIRALYDGWAKAHYATPDAAERAAALEQLNQRAIRLVKNYPTKAEPLIWEAILESTQAEDAGSRTALRLAEHARDLLLRAEQINPGALHGSIYTTLGALYFRVPGWPIGFGDNAKAEAYLKKAQTYDPTGLQTNDFYGQFLFDQGRYREAVEMLERAAASPPGETSGTPDLGERGRREDVANLLAQASSKAKGGMRR